MSKHAWIGLTDRKGRLALVTPCPYFAYHSYVRVHGQLRWERLQPQSPAADGDDDAARQRGHHARPWGGSTP